MQTSTGRSFLSDAASAVGEATAQMPATADVVFAFFSTQQEPAATAAALRTRFPGAVIVGSSSTGELKDGEQSNGSLVVSALQTPRIAWASTLVPLDGFSSETAKRAADVVFGALDVDRERFDPAHYVGLLFVDGLSMKEELVAAELAGALDGISLVGGSAGDDLRFARTHVLHGGEARHHAAVLVLAHTPDGHDVFKHQHFGRSNTALAVTRVDPAARRVYELDGLPAQDAYAKAIGVERSALTADLAFLKPLVFPTAGDVYVRSVQQLHDDGSISFYCAVEEGMVLEVGGHGDMVTALSDAVSLFKRTHADAKFFLGFNCILRALESKNTGAQPALTSLLQQLAPSSLAFDTYGEQLNGLHINQTLVGVCLRESGSDEVVHV